MNSSYESIRMRSLSSPWYPNMLIAGLLIADTTRA